MFVSRVFVCFVLCTILVLHDAFAMPASAGKGKSKKGKKQVKKTIKANAKPVTPSTSPVVVQRSPLGFPFGLPFLPSGSSASSSSSAKPVASTSSTSTSAPASTSLPSNPQTRDKVRGVNLGGWFIIEPWMSPSLITQAASTTGKSASSLVDQWTIMQAFSDQSKAKTFLQKHWSSWIVESDFAQIKSVGLNTVRLPVPHWAFNGSTSEPYVAYAEQSYISQALRWASKYNLDVVLDLHTAPNSQNGYENSGHAGNANFRSVDGPTNVARLNSALRSLVQLFVNDAQYNGVVKYVEVLNEPTCYSLGADFMTSVYASAAATVQSAVASNARTKPQLIMHDCFVSPLSNWQPAVQSGGGLANVSFTLDTHRYHVFAPRDNMSLQQHLDLCHQDGDEIAAAATTLNRPILTGEFSLAISCTDCTFNSTQAIAAANRQFFATQTTAYERGVGWIFWNWKSEQNLPWSFKDALLANWIPSNPADKSAAK